MYSYASTSISATGVTTETTGTLSFPLLLALVVIVAPGAAVALGAVSDFRVPAAVAH